MDMSAHFVHVADLLCTLHLIEGVDEEANSLLAVVSISLAVDFRQHLYIKPDKQTHF